MTAKFFANNAPLTLLAATERDLVARAIENTAEVLKDPISQANDTSGAAIYVGVGGVGLALQKWEQFHAKNALLQQPAALSGALKACETAMDVGTSKEDAVKQMCDIYERDVSALPAGECELLYGRAGFLYSLLALERIIGTDTRMDEMKMDLVRHMVEEGLRGAAASGLQQWGLMYSWHGKHYLGAAHGLCGILHMLLHCKEELQAVRPRGEALQLVKTAVTALAGSCLPSGNLPSSMGRSDDRLVQWCHGAAGFIPLMCKCHEVLGACDGLWLGAAEHAADVLWERGLLKKGVGLCHGISGNGYAFLSLYRCTGEVSYLSRAEQFALFAAQHWQELYHVPDRPASLFEGLAGALCFWIDVLQPDQSRFIGFEL